MNSLRYIGGLTMVNLFTEDHMRNLPTIRLAEIVLENFKSVKYGKIVLNCGKKHIPYGTKADILGVYGQNGSGKTALIEAISILKSIDGCVIFMSDDETHRYPGELFFNNQKIKNFVARADAKELAELIEKEWFSSYELAEEGLYNPPPILPQDLYVFNKSMNWFILFTHEAETVDPTSRFCILHNISK